MVLTYCQSGSINSRTVSAVRSTPTATAGLGLDAEAGALDRLGDGGHVRPFGQAHLAA